MVEAIHYATGKPISIEIAHGKINSISPLKSPSAGLPYVAPGFVDIHINGLHGLDFNTMPVPDGLVEQAIRKMFADGVTCSFPTFITNSSENFNLGLSAVAKACGQSALVARSVGGIHMEGPYISPEDGARGAHPKQHVKAPDWDEFRRWQDIAGGRIRIMTMSPEWPGSAEFISRVAGSGVVVSIGHTAATPEQVHEAVAAGARMSTHLGNGAHLMLQRHPNYIWQQLAEDALWACMICDGFHLPDTVIKVIMRVKQDHAIIVSDAVSLAGLPPGVYETPVGGKVLLAESGRLCVAENPKLLAGSAQMMPWHISHMLKARLADLPTAWDMASLHPAKFMNLPSQSGLATGAPADLALFRVDNGAVRIAQTLSAGEIVFSA